MYDRFTDRARKAIRLANQEAQRFNHQYIGTEHILLGLVKEGSGVAANVLKDLDIDLRKVRLEFEKIVPGPFETLSGQFPQTPRAKKVIEYAIEEARSLKHDWVGTEHLLLGLMRESEGVAGQVLRNLGLTLEGLRQEVTRLGPPGTSRMDGRDELPDVTHLPPDIRDAVIELNAQIEALDEQKEAAVAEEDFEKAARLRDEADRVKKKRQELIRAAGEP